VDKPRPRFARPVAKLRQGADWYRIVRAQADGQPAEIYIYDEIGFWGTTAQQFIDELHGVIASQIDLHINSPGGEVFDGIAIYNALLDHAARVEVYVDGLAASAASFIAQAGDRITMAANAQMMIHQAFGLCMGNAGDMAQMRDMLGRLDVNLASIYAARSGVGGVEEWLAQMAAETWYNATEAVQAGLADVAQSTPRRGEPAQTDPAPQDRWDLSVFTFQGRQQAPAPNIRQATRRPPDRGEAVPAGPLVAHAAQVHHPDTVDPGSWDGPAQEKKLSSPMSTATADKAFAYYDEAKVASGEIVKAACKLLHHEVSADGVPGAAHLGGVRAALQRLPQSTIPKGEHPAIERHLHAHLDDAPADHADPFAHLPDEMFASVAAAVEDALDPMGGYDPQVLGATILDVYADAAAPPALPPRPEPPRTAITIDEMIEAIQEGVRP
jgi:ATP-dependent protease ClpP protease subunit